MEETLGESVRLGSKGGGGGGRSDALFMVTGEVILFSPNSGNSGVPWRRL